MMRKAIDVVGCMAGRQSLITGSADIHVRMFQLRYHRLPDESLLALDGIRMIKLIRQQANDKSVPIIVLSGGYGHMRKKALEAGANYALSKPLQLKLLYDLTTELLRKSTNDY